MESPVKDELGATVELNVYDLQHPDNPEAVPTINFYLYNMGVGLYHSGVSVYGREYCFGGHPHSSTGIFEVSPKSAPDAKFRETVFIGRTYLSEHQVAQLIHDMSEVWAGNSYSLLKRNCNHFANDLCERLTGNAAPDWINRLAWMAEKAKFLLPAGFDQPMSAPVRDPSLTSPAVQNQARQGHQDRLLSSSTESDEECDPDHDA